VAKNLVIVESPAKAKTIEKYLGKDFKVEASMGHVRDLPPKELGVDIEHDFKPEYAVLAGKKRVLATLKKVAKSASAVFMATDLDREGEAIAWHLCEALELDSKTVQRVVFNEITKPAITAAFANPGHINMDKVSAQEARRILDRLVGYKLSPLLWKKVAKGLSAGRVQSVAVRLVVEREREIREFRPEEFWTISADLSRRGDEQTFKAALAEVNGEKFRPSKGDEARGIGDKLRRAAYKVQATRKKTAQDKAPPPFITSELQRAASTQLGFSTKKTMTIAQALYQGVELGPEGSVALITYMRTDSYHIAPAAIAAARDLIGQTFGPAYLPDQPQFFKSRGRAQEAHEAIRPTDVTRTPEPGRRPASDPEIPRPGARLRRAHQGHGRAAGERRSATPRAGRGRPAGPQGPGGRAALHAAAAAVQRGNARARTGGPRHRPAQHVRGDHLNDPGPRLRGPAEQSVPSLRHLSEMSVRHSVQHAGPAHVADRPR
jgi:DNA topoisomerase-1